MPSSMALMIVRRNLHGRRCSSPVRQRHGGGGGGCEATGLGAEAHREDTGVEPRRDSSQDHENGEEAGDSDRRRLQRRRLRRSPCQLRRRGRPHRSCSSLPHLPQWRVHHRCRSSCRCSALNQKGIYTFVDSEELRQGEQISPSLMRAIEALRVAIIIFSEDYASLRWCLEELATIMEFEARKELIVLPVFYKVEPREVRRRIKVYGRAMAKHESECGKDLETVKRWKKALSDANNLSGWDFSDGLLSYPTSPRKGGLGQLIRLASL